MPDEALRIVLDTNVLLVSVSSRSKHHWIFQSLLAGDYELFVNTEILLEYEEIIGDKLDGETAGNVVRTLLLLPNVRPVQAFYNWNLITADPDDNKFVDCAVAANAHALVSHDRHLKILDSVEFPKLRVMTAAAFRELLDRHLKASE